MQQAMNQQNTLRQWYDSSQNQDLVHLNSPLQAAFEEAKTKFASDLTDDRHKIEYASSASSLQLLQDEVFKSATKYEVQRKDSKARKWLERLSQRIVFYGTVFDVVAQHHPEYVALAWGSIKFLLQAVINHEKVATTLAKAMSQIADLVPHAELKLDLFPTDHMQSAIADLYAFILRFLIRARDWYEEGKLQHFLHSITRPVELRYDDLLEQISHISQRIKRLAMSAHLAEIRCMHNELKGTKAVVDQMSNTMTLHSSALLDTSQRLSDLQFSNIMASLSNVSIWDPMKAYQYHYAVKRRRCHSRVVHTLPNKFWRSPKLRHWLSTDDSVISIIAGNFQARFIVRNLCIQIIEQLHRAEVPVLLAMKVPEIATSANVSQSDLLKYLVRQAIQLKKRIQTEKSMAFWCATFQDAATEAEWFQLLEATLAEIGGLLYIIVDLEILDKSLSPVDNFSWIQAFEQIFHNLTLRNLSTQIKVLLFSYGSSPLQLSAAERRKFVTPARAEAVTARHRKFVGAPKALDIRH